MLIPSPAFAPSGPDTPIAHWAANGCPKGYAIKSAKRGIRANMRRPKANRARARYFARCTRSPKAEVAMRAKLVEWRFWRQRNADRLRYRRFEAKLPYDCGTAGRFAIPCYIVACESGYSWSAYNPSGAAGPYQIMGSWGRPWPVATPADRKAHHQIAASIWAGGSGASNWVCA